MRLLDVCAALVAACALAGCTEPHPKVGGTMRFVLGGTSGSTAPTLAGASVQTSHLVAGHEYLVSPRQARITFTSVVFSNASTQLNETSTFEDCTVTYDRSRPSGSTLLECPFTIPVGEISQMALYFDKTLEILVSDATFGIYSDAAIPSKFSATPPAGGATFVPFTITIGDGTSRATTIIFPAPLTIAEGTTPTLYVTTDMIHTVQLIVNAGGATLTAKVEGNDPVALFGTLTPGMSMFYSNATTIEARRVEDSRYLRVFTDQGGNPLYLIGWTCGADGGPKGAWASAPIGQKVGGWLGRDASGVLAWALPTSDTYSTYAAYFVMPEATTVGQTTVQKCQATSSPPPPADGKTYSSGAPSMAFPTTSTTLTLLGK